MTTPFDHKKILPNFSNIKTDEIEKNIKNIIAENLNELSRILKTEDAPTWDNFIAPQENCSEKLHHYWSLVSHLHSVVDNEKLRQAYDNCLAELSAYSTKVSHNKNLYIRTQQLQQSIHADTKNPQKKRAVDNDVRDFKLSGISLDESAKQKYKELSESLSQLTSSFSQNVLDATDNWYFHATDEKQLSGLPEHTVQYAAQVAKQKNISGWAFGLQGPTFIAVMSYADDDEMRRSIYEAFVTRASEKGPDANKWNNTPIITKILQARQDLSVLLGFENYAKYSLQTKMVKKPQQVIDFLKQLSSASFDKAKKEMQELSKFAAENGGPEELQPWQIGYYTEKLRQAVYNFSAEDLRPYFPLPQVLKGLFNIASKLYNIRIEEVKQFDSWHQDVSCYAIYDFNNEDSAPKNQTPRAYFYLDPYARDQKRGGAWMDDCRSRRKMPDGEIQIPIAFLVCNFNAPTTEDTPALLTHDDVVTLFHEFGHGLHHMLTKVDVLGLSGINGVAWDAVELPSQFMENWAYEKQSLGLFAKHYKTGEIMPDQLFEKMQKARNFQSAMHMMRQLEFSLFDFELHMQTEKYTDDTTASILSEVRKQTRVTPVYKNDRFQNGFSHIFAGGYAAGYYSYKWAEVMAADAYDVFKKHGAFSTKHSLEFLNCILEKGGSEDAAKLFHDFRKRAPEVNALLKQEGIINE